MTAGGVVGWVAGEPVLAEDLALYMRLVSSETVGSRLGLSEGVGAPAASTKLEPKASLRVGREQGHQSGREGPSSQTGQASKGALRFSKEAALRTWAAKHLLIDRLVSAEAARLGVGNIGCLDEWVRALEAKGELAAGEPDEAEALSCYRANLHRYRAGEARRVRHLLVGERELAARLASQVKAAGGPPLGDLAAAWSLDEGSRRHGGDLGWVERGQLAGALEDAIFSATLGEVLGPVESTFGWHVLAVEALRPAGTRSFASCRGEILRELAADRRRAALRQWWAKRLAEAVAVPPGAEHPSYPGLPGTLHRH